MSVSQGCAPGTSVHFAESRQVLVATQTGGSTGTFHGTWTRYEWTGTQWLQVGGDGVEVRFGKHGVQDGNTRVMGSSTTPSGTFALPLAFGEADPGTAMPYNTITGCSWWLDVDALEMGRPDLFNRWFEDCATTYPHAGNLSELRDRGLYRQAVVIGHNYADPRKTSGPGSSSAIFLHYAPADGYTAGCVGLTSMAELTDTVRWLAPSSNPVIVIR